jgi:hypothetical protein
MSNTEAAKENDTPSSSNKEAAAVASAADAYSLKVKPEFILKERASSLPPLPVIEDGINNGGGGDARDQPKVDDDRDSNNRGGNRSNNNKKKKKARGQNKKRPRDQRQDDSEKICLAILRGDHCPFGNGNCRFSHDVKAYMATRPADIVEIDGGCPNYNTHGFCMYGAMCRVGGNHISKAGENLRKEMMVMNEEEAAKKDTPKKDEKETAEGENKVEEKRKEKVIVYERDVINNLSKDLQVRLRKKEYRK